VSSPLDVAAETTLTFEKISIIRKGKQKGIYPIIPNPAKSLVGAVLPSPGRTSILKVLGPKRRNTLMHGVLKSLAKVKTAPSTVIELFGAFANVVREGRLFEVRYNGRDDIFVAAPMKGIRRVPPSPGADELTITQPEYRGIFEVSKLVLSVNVAVTFVDWPGSKSTVLGEIVTETGVLLSSCGGKNEICPLVWLSP